MFRPLLLSTSFLLCFFSAVTPSLADEDGRLQPRFETGLKYGTERSIGSGEVWVPLDQGQDRVLYGDLRLMGDDDDNTEGNLGVGYRQLIQVPGTNSQAIGGVHGWIDRRHTDHDNNFHQATLGAELLGHDLDARINAYIPLNDEKSYRTPNIGNATPYLAGSGILYDTTGTAIEEPQPGVDLELGWRLPILEQHTEAIRLYGGGYHFEGDQTEDVTGWRTRLVADISPAVSIGGRFQRDDERGSQAFIEATLRFPFQAKKSFRAEGLKARLDESPERDIDIVAGSKVTDTGLAKPVLAAATGEQQRVLHVDNTAAPGGDGSKEQPFHQLKLAEAALQANDVIYVHAGDGTTTGQDQGIVIDKPGVSLIGSGSDFIYDAGRFTTDKGANFTGILLAEATTAPVITNTQPTFDFATGNGILTLTPNISIRGINVQDSSRDGLRIEIKNYSEIAEFIEIDNVASKNNAYRGMVINVDNSLVKNVSVNNALFDSNDDYGLQITSQNGGMIHILDVDSVNSFGNLRSGILINSQGTGGNIESLHISRTNANNNAEYGLQIISNTSSNISGNIWSSAMEGNGYQGLVLSAFSDANIALSIEETRFLYNQRDGVYINDDTIGSFAVDLGGGPLGSTGGNSIHGNGISNPALFRQFMVLDLDGGILPAQGNWWGQPGSPDPAQFRSEAACPNCGTADTSNALDSDPNL